MIRWLLLLAWVVGRAVAAEPAAIRVVSQTVGTDELLLSVADPGQIAALSFLSRDPNFSAVATEAARYPQLVQGDAETVLRYRPTLVLAANYSRPELIAQIRRAGVRVVLFDHYDTLADAYANLRRVGRELGPAAAARAERVIASCERRVTALQHRLRGVIPVRVIAPSTYGVIPGAGTVFEDLCEHAGAINLAATLGHIRGDQPPPDEQMLTWPIDRVVVAGATSEAALAPFRSLPPYAFMPAIRQNRVALLEPYMLSCVTQYRIVAYERLARELHPEAFK